MNKQRVWAFFAVLVLIISMVACGNKSASGGGKDEKVTLRLSFWFGAADLPAWQKGVDDYMAANPNVNIILESTPWAEYWTKLRSQMSANTQADIIGMVSMQSDYFIRNNALLDLGPYIRKENFDLSDVWPGMMKAYTVGDSIYCLPYDLSVNLLLCNLDMFEEAGVEFKPLGYTMDEFLQISKKLTTANHYASDFYPDGGYNLYDAITSAGVDPTDATGNIALNKPDVVEVIQWIADLNLKHGTQIRYDRVGRDGRANFLSRKVAMIPVQGEWTMKIRAEMPDTKLDVMYFPFVGRNGRKVTEGGSFAASSKTKYPEVAWDFIKNYTSAERLGEIIGATHRGIPGRISAAPLMLTSKYAVPHSQLFFDAMQGSTWINYPYRAECEIELVNFIDRVFIGELTAQQGMDAFMEAVADIQKQ
ncbi:sugar ABC transporter substrate-binding protein [Spirochaetia bacterium]|nr:sugar ABC transporter substrate-binding protein [Spirochaetia bacterium]